MPNSRFHSGYWYLQCDCGLASNCPKMQPLTEMQNKFPGLFPAPPKETKIDKRNNIVIYTSDNSEEGIERSAEAIRSSIDFPFVMYHYKISGFGPKDLRLQYMHTPDYELYKFFQKCTASVSHWEFISRKRPADNFYQLLPSKVLDKNYSHLPPSEADFEKAKGEKGGKWVVFCSDFETLDHYWKILTRLYRAGIIVALKANTANFSIAEIYPLYRTNIIMCYTSDADCTDCIKRTAECITMCTRYRYVMYYKTNQDSKDGKYRSEGFYRFSKYMFTEAGNLYEKDVFLRWKKVHFDENKSK